MRVSSPFQFQKLLLFLVFTLFAFSSCELSHPSIERNPSPPEATAPKVDKESVEELEKLIGVGVGEKNDAEKSKLESKKSAPVWVDGPKGKEDIRPTLDRIARGEKHSHRNDGSTFFNREKLLPIKKRGYYKEYVHPTKGRSGPGAQRLVLGSSDEIYYTPDHYKSFQEVKDGD